MNKTAIKNFAIWARVQLIESAKQRAYEYEITEDGENKTNIDAIGGRLLSNDEKDQRRQLIAQIHQKGYTQVMEKAAYTWFNRFIALRFMEVNGYLPSKTRVFTDETGAFKPEIMKQAMSVELEGLDRNIVLKLIDSQANDELYKYLLITQCNALNACLPTMFETIANWTELLFPNNLLRPDSVLGHMVSDIPEEDWQDAVQIIGWLYQYYNTELKDDTFAQLKKNVKITKERIPAATQLFTPDWIVRYMVENSLGRLWLEGHPNAELHDGWKYYLDEAEQEPEVEVQLAKLREEYKTIKPEEIKVIDPCMGSGHILVYAFDVLMQIYTSAGWDQREAARSILKNNLFGLDIDDRAAQLAYFAVMMKARQYDRRLLTRGIQPNIYSIRESNGIQAMTIEYFRKNDPKLKADIESIVTEMRDAKEYGSILNITPVDFAGLYARFDEIREDINMMQMSALDELLPVVRCAEVLARKYDVVVTNPPYMGASGMNARLAQHIKDHFPDTKADLFSCFIERGFQLANVQGFVSMITMESWMFLSSFEKMRQNIVNTHTIVNMVHMPYLGKGGTSLGINFGTAAVIFNKCYCRDYNSQFDYICYYETDENGVPFAFPTVNERYKAAKATNFSKIPGSPVAYWVSANTISAFEQGILADYADTKQGFATGDNNRFLRLWHEVAWSKVGIGYDTNEAAKGSRKKWFPANKGGSYRRWYGNNYYVANWENDGQEMKAFDGSVIRNPQYYFRQGITWSSLSSAGVSMRFSPKGFLFESKGSMCYFKNDDNLTYILALMNTKVVDEMLLILAPTLDYHEGPMSKVPTVIDADKKEVVGDISKNNIAIAKDNWDSCETSWDFKRNPLV